MIDSKEYLELRIESCMRAFYGGDIDAEVANDVVGILERRLKELEGD